LSADVGAEVYLFDSQTLKPWQVGLDELPAALSSELQESREARSLTLLRMGSEHAWVMEMPSLSSCKILVARGYLLDDTLVHHLVSVLGGAIERVQAQLECKLRLGAEAMDDLFCLRLSEHAAAERLASLGFSLEGATLAVLQEGVEMEPFWQHRLRRIGVNLLTRKHGDDLVVLLQEPEDASWLNIELDCFVGQSRPIGNAMRFSEALSEARLALAHASAQTPVASYRSDLKKKAWLPGNLEDARNTHRQVLGALADYDEQQGGQMQHTLRVFLEHNRSWQKASLMLNVHKQTLVYRIRRIEEITKRSLDSTEDVAVMWIALRAAEVAGLSNT